MSDTVRRRFVSLAGTGARFAKKAEESPSASSGANNKQAFDTAEEIIPNMRAFSSREADDVAKSPVTILQWARFFSHCQGKLVGAGQLPLHFSYALGTFVGRRT